MELLDSLRRGDSVLLIFTAMNWKAGRMKLWQMLKHRRTEKLGISLKSLSQVVLNSDVENVQPE